MSDNEEKVRVSNPVLFKFGSRSEYEHLLQNHTIQDNALYFLLDTNELYRGAIPIAQVHYYEGEYEDGEDAESAIIRTMTGETPIPGDILTLYTDVEHTAMENYLYVADGTWRSFNGGSGAIGAAHNADNVSIEIQQGDFSLKNWGTAYYKYVPAANDVPAHYERQEVNNTHPWKAGLEPRVTTEDGQLVLAWYEPNSDTVDGLSNALETLRQTVESHTTRIEGHDDRLDALEQQVNGLNSAFQFKGVVADQVELITMDTTNLRAGDVYQIVENGAEFAWDGTQWVELGTTVDLTPITQEVNSLRELVGEVPAGENPPDKTVLERLDDIEQGLALQIALGGTIVQPVNNVVNIPIFEGSDPGLVPARDDEIVDANYVLSAAGTWIEPMDPRIGDLRYNKHVYPTVESYVGAVFDDFSLEWQEIEPREV